MVIIRQFEHPKIEQMLIQAIRKRISTIQTYCSNGCLPLVGSPIPYYVTRIPEFDEADVTACHTGWRALVLSNSEVMLAGLHKNGEAVRYAGLRFGKYPRFFSKACLYAERKLESDSEIMLPRILFIPRERTHFLWLHGKRDFFVKIPITHAKARFHLSSTLIIGHAVIAGFDESGKALLKTPSCSS